MACIAFQFKQQQQTIYFQMEESSYGVQVNHTSQVTNTDIRLTSMNTVQIQIKN